MATEENFHSGHRERMTTKLLNSPDSFCEHELLEVLLYDFLPRVDTNLIAHKLLKTFGNIKNLFEAKAEDIMSIDGIGKKTACKIVLLGKVMDMVNKEKEKLPNVPFNNLDSFKDYLAELFEDARYEKLVILMLDRKQFPFAKLEYKGNSYSQVLANTEDILHSLAINKPSFVIICHNHPSGNVTPSEDDDLATSKFYMICSVAGISFSDHIIIGKKNQLYSYFLEGKLAKIKNNAKLENLLKERI